MVENEYVRRESFDIFSDFIHYALTIQNLGIIYMNSHLRICIKYLTHLYIVAVKYYKRIVV